MYNTFITIALKIPDMAKIEKAFVQLYICLAITLFLWNSINAISFAYGIDYGEAPLMDQARRLTTGTPLYKSGLNTAPYVIANYPPMYPALISFVISVLHSPLFQTGRIISFAFSVLVGYIIGLFAYHLTNNKWLGIFGSALFFGHLYVVFWSSLARVDMMALGFSLLGLWILYRYRDGAISIVLATIFFLLSVFTKQTYLLAGPLAGLIWLWNINRKRALYFFALLSVTGFLIFGTINALTSGGFYTNIIASNINEFFITLMLSAIKHYFFIWPIISIVSLIATVLAVPTRFSVYFRNRLEPLTQPFIFNGLVFYTLGAIISAITIGKIGSNVNYFLELIVACSIWFVIAWKMFFVQKFFIRWTFFVLILLQAVWVSTNSFGLIQSNLQWLRNRAKIDQFLNQKINKTVDSGMVLSDDYMDLIVLSGQPIYYQPFEYGELYYTGQWDPTTFVEQINHREFPLVIVGGNSLDKNCCWPPPVQLALQSNYQFEHFGEVLILTPLK